MASFDTLQCALRWLESLPKSSSRTHHSNRKKVETIKTLLALCDNPQKKLHLIHITGSKGKSTVAKTAHALLGLQKYKVGLFISPHVNVYNERICIDGQMISDKKFLCVLTYIHVKVIEYQRHNPQFIFTVFEILTAAAFCAFRDAKCEWAVIEVGIGGRYDTTNIIEPKLCIITEIEYEHINILGPTITEIAHEKAGIIKDKVPVWVAIQPYQEVLHILKKTAEMKQSPFFYMKEHCIIENIAIHTQGTSADVSLTLHGIKHTFKYETITLSKALLDDQILAYTALAHYFIDTKNENETIHKIISNQIQMRQEINLPARCELLRGNPNIFLDGAHTERSIENSCACLQALFPKACLVIGMLKGKNHRAVSEVLRKQKDFFSHVIVTTCGEKLDSAHETLYEMLREHFPTAQMCLRIKDALSAAEDFCNTHINSTTIKNEYQNSVIGVIGSLYLCSACRTLVKP